MKTNFSNMANLRHYLFVLFFLFVVACQPTTIEVTKPINIDADGHGEFFTGEKEDELPTGSVIVNTSNNETMVGSSIDVTTSITEYTIGRSANGQSISVVQIGNGAKAVVIVGGMHAGFAPATVELAEDLIDYFQEKSNEIPPNIALYIIAVANPDSVTGNVESKSGRLNGNGVDINRNWGCNWSSNAVWRDESINPGSQAFSEPETIALRDFFLDIDPEAVIFFEAKGNLIAPGACNGTIKSSSNLARVYSNASGYDVGEITGYTLTGDVSDWLDNQGIPSIAILLSSYTSMDWSKNLNGVLSVLNSTS